MSSFLIVVVAPIVLLYVGNYAIDKLIERTR
jgi:hypothetical protein